MLKKFKSDPKAVWDKQQHDADNKWVLLGREKGGWWKCRAGSDAIEVERQCRQCHRFRTQAEWVQEQKEQRRGKWLWNLKVPLIAAHN